MAATRTRTASTTAPLFQRRVLVWGCSIVACLTLAKTAAAAATTNHHAYYVNKDSTSVQLDNMRKLNHGTRNVCQLASYNQNRTTTTSSFDVEFILAARDDEETFDEEFLMHQIHEHAFECISEKGGNHRNSLPATTTKLNTRKARDFGIVSFTLLGVTPGKLCERKRPHYLGSILD